MRSVALVTFLFAVAPGINGGSLRVVNPHESVIPNTQNALVTAKHAPQTKSNSSIADEALIAQLRAKLTAVSGGFHKLLGGKIAGSEASFNTTLVGAMMSKIETNLQTVLAETATVTNVSKAKQQLQAANVAVQQLSQDMNDEQVRLMHENNEQSQSLLLGVLMQHQKEPMNQQLEVLNNPDFAKLPVVVAILGVKDMKTPLFKQVAAYLDAHTVKEVEPSMPDELKKGKDGKPDVTPIILALEARVRKMVENEQRVEEQHQEEMMVFDRQAEMKKNNSAFLHHISHLKKRDTQTFAKQYATAKRDIKTMESAIESVKKGDMVGLVVAQKALIASRKAAEARSGHFVYLIQLMSHLEARDCPFCVAQCVGKCHNNGMPYASCLTTCADSGK